jgi:hypothetical protein
MYIKYIMKTRSSLRRTQIYLEEDVLQELRKRARREKTTIAALIREALSLMVLKKRKLDWTNDPILKITAIGKSAEGDLSSRHDKYLYPR